MREVQKHTEKLKSNPAYEITIKNLNEWQKWNKWASHDPSLSSEIKIKKKTFEYEGIIGWHNHIKTVTGTFGLSVR